MAVEWASGFTLNGAASAFDSATDTISLTPFSVGVQSNQVLILWIIAHSLGSTAPTVSSISYSEGTFTQFYSNTFQNGAISVEGYIIVNPTVSANKTITITMTGTSTHNAAHVGAFRNAYQGTPLSSHIESDSIVNALVYDNTHPDPDSNAALHDACFNYSPTSPNLAFGDGQTSVVASEGGTRSFYMTVLGSLSVPQDSGYQSGSGTDNYGVVVSLQVKPA